MLQKKFQESSLEPTDTKYKKEQLDLDKENFINNYLSPIPEKYNKSKEEERKFLTKYLQLKDLPSDPRLISEIRLQLLNKFSEEFHKNLTNIDTVFLTNKWFFGNSFISINNLLFYSKIMGCKNIY